jgi:hypothetical protein
MKNIGSLDTIDEFREIFYECLEKQTNLDWVFIYYSHLLRQNPTFCLELVQIYKENNYDLTNAKKYCPECFEII